LKILKINNLYKAYHKGSQEIPVLKGVSFDIDAGAFVSIVGKSGSGKSTLLNLIGGLDQASSGSLYFQDKDIVSMSRAELALHRRLSVGMVFQSFNLIPARTAVDNVTLALMLGGVARSKRVAKAKELLTQVGLGHRFDHKPSELSGGEMQRVAIARALANQPLMLLADEPTGNLDSTTSDSIIDLMQTLNRERGLTIVMVTHDQEMADAISTQIIRIKDGKLEN